MNLNDAPSAGPLTAADVAEARRFGSGAVLYLHRATYTAWPCEWESCTGAACTHDHRECMQAAPEGGKHADPVPSGTHRQTLISRAWLALRRWMR